MFYSHQLLARKAPLGQIWMAATMHAKINRRNLEKIDIVRICEEILNPSVPLALRLSGILMGGVVIVYERKVKLLYDDVTRLLVQINEAWRGKAVGDPTILPKGKSQAKHEAVTLKDDVEMDQALRFSDTMTFEHQNYYPMQLGQFEEFTIRDEGQPQPHQVDASHTTLQDDFESHQAEINIYDRFERFDIEGEEEGININFTPQDPPHTVDVPESPKQKPASEVPLQANANQHEPDKEQHESTTKSQQVEQDIHDLAQQRRQNKRTRPRATHFLMDERIIIPGHEYQPWLQNTSDIISRREKKKLPMSLQLKKMSKLMDLPTMALISDMNNDMLEVWKKFSQLQTDRDQPGRESPSHLYENLNHHEHQFEFVAAEDFQNGLEAEQLHSSLDKGRDDIDFPRAGDALSGRKLFGTSAGSSGGQSVKSIPSSASGSRSFQLEQESTAGRSKRTHSSASHSLGGLDPVSEEISLHIRKNSKLPRVLENGSIGSNHMMASPFYPEFVASPTAPELELLEETAPTQTPRPAPPSSIDKTTHSILKHLKEHFSAPCAPQTESLNQLTLGMNRKQAAKLFYQTCVLASHNFIRVEQVEAYGDISISRGNKM